MSGGRKAPPLTEPDKIALWDQLLHNQGCVFRTSGRGTQTGVSFSYVIRGAEIFVSVKEKSVTRSSVMAAFRKAKELDGNVPGPKKLGVFGASYIYPIFVSLGIIKAAGTQVSAKEELPSSSKTKYHVILSEDERQRLEIIIRDKTETAKTILRANILLALDSEEKKTDKKPVRELAESLGTTHTTIQTVKASYCEEGLDATLSRKRRTVTKVNKRINDSVIERIIELAGQQPPMGSKRWTIRSLCQECVERGIVSHISASTMQAILRNAGIALKSEPS